VLLSGLLYMACLVCFLIQPKIACPGMAPPRVWWADERAQMVKELAAKPSNLSSIPGTYVMEGENLLLKVIF